METMVGEQKNERVLRLKMRMAVLRYVIVNAFLVFVNWMTSPHYWWVLWVIAGWGVGLLLKLAEYGMKRRMDKDGNYKIR